MIRVRNNIRNFSNKQSSRQEQEISGHDHISRLGAPRPDTLAAILQWRATIDPDRPACGFLGDGVVDVTQAACRQWTYAELAGRAAAIAAALREHHAGRCDGARVLIVCPPGLEFVAAFFGCLLAGAVAVPIQPPSRRQDAGRWQHVVGDADPSAVLTTAVLRAAAEALFAALARQPAFIDVSEAMEVPAGDLALARAVPGDVAFLQYTSGSTRQPRGVQVTHANLMHNLGQIERRFGHDADSRGVIWLPPHHDMGLIGGILQPVFAGFPVTLMSPASFLRRPLRWLQAVSALGATTSGGPNFAYEYCLRRIAAGDRSSVDLSHWKVAFSGAETVRAGTLDRFAEAFADSGFRRDAFVPCYGLAESTLLAASVRVGAGPREFIVEREALRAHRAQAAASGADAQTLVGCGSPADDTQMLIVDAVSAQALADGAVGEIWLSGPGVSPGYRNGDADAQRTFGAHLSDGRGPFLRTGDLGFMHAGELFVTGRLRDLLVIRGANHAPQDVELSVEQAHPRFAPASAAAFTVEHDGEEALVLVQELDRGDWPAAALDAACDAIRAVVSNDHGLQVQVIALVKFGSLPKTPSGKVQRQRCRSAFIDGALDALRRWSALDARQPAVDAAADLVAGDALAGELVAWLRECAETSINSRLMDERRSLSPSLLLDFGNRGLLGMQVPRSHGGLGLGHRATLRVIEQLGAIDATLALFVGLNNVLGIRPILNHGSAALRDEWLPRLATGRELAAFALTEEGAGSHPHAMAATARPRDGGWAIDGRKIWSGSAAWAGIVNVFVRQCDAAGQVTGISAFAVPRGRAGLSQGPEAMTMGMRAMVQNSVLFDGVPVGAADLLGREGEGMSVAQDAMMYGRLVIAAACVGGMKRCAQMMLRYAGRRSVASGLLLDHPVTRERLGVLTAAIEAMTALVDDIAGRLDAGRDVPEEAYAACKILAPELYWQATDWLVQCLGGRGYIESSLAPQMLRDARVLRIFEGPTETLAGYLGARVLRQPAAFDRYMNTDLAAPGITAAVRELVATVADLPDAPRRAGCAVGGLAAHSILLAALAARSDASAHALDWAQQGVERARQAVQSLRQHEPAAGAALRARIERYARSIGDVQQRAAGEDVAVDPLLQRAADAAAPVASSTPAVMPLPAVAAASTEERVARWMGEWLARHLNLDARRIDGARAFADYGVDSVMAVELAQDLESEFALSQPLDATLAWNYPTVAALSARIAVLMQAPEVVAASAPSAEASLDDLSEAELARLLEAELASPAS